VDDQIANLIVAQLLHLSSMTLLFMILSLVQRPGLKNFNDKDLLILLLV